MDLKLLRNSKAMNSTTMNSTRINVATTTVVTRIFGSVFGLPIVRIPRPILLSTIATVFFLAPAAHASSGHGAPSIGDLTFYWINFALYIGFMTYILRKPLAKGWAARAARIKQSVTQSSDDVASAERELNAIEALTKSLPVEEEKIKQQIAEQAEAEARDVIRQAEQRAVRIREQARELVKGEARSAQSAFRQSLVARAVQLAKEKFAAGEFTGREELYQTATVNRAKQLVEH
jgi:F0F1-type ATP synthase membrane subunit b/b'